MVDNSLNSIEVQDENFIFTNILDIKNVKVGDFSQLSLTGV